MKLQFIVLQQHIDGFTRTKIYLRSDLVQQKHHVPGTAMHNTLAKRCLSVHHNWIYCLWLLPLVNIAEWSFYVHWKSRSILNDKRLLMHVSIWQERTNHSHKLCHLLYFGKVELIRKCKFLAKFHISMSNSLNSCGLYRPLFWLMLTGLHVKSYDAFYTIYVKFELARSSQKSSKAPAQGTVFEENWLTDSNSCS